MRQLRILLWSQNETYHNSFFQLSHFYSGRRKNRLTFIDLGKRPLFPSSNVCLVICEGLESAIKFSKYRIDMRPRNNYSLSYISDYFNSFTSALFESAIFPTTAESSLWKFALSSDNFKDSSYSSLATWLALLPFFNFTWIVRKSNRSLT